MRDRPKTMTLNQIFFSTKIFEKYNFLVSVLIYYFHYAKTFNKISNQGLFSGFLILFLLLGFGMSLDKSQHIYFINTASYFWKFSIIFVMPGTCWDMTDESFSSLGRKKETV